MKKLNVVKKLLSIIFILVISLVIFCEPILAYDASTSIVVENSQILPRGNNTGYIYTK